MTKNEIETEIQEKKLTAPRVTPADIKHAIASEHYFTAQHGIEGASAKSELVCRTADTDTLKEKSPHPPYDTLRTLTFCVLALRNGFTVVGQSACASPENFDAELGRKIAYQRAEDQLWPLLGYALKDRLWTSSV